MMRLDCLSRLNSAGFWDGLQRDAQYEEACAGIKAITLELPNHRSFASSVSAIILSARKHVIIGAYL
jgi:hypothetical protein